MFTNIIQCLIIPCGWNTPNQCASSYHYENHKWFRKLTFDKFDKHLTVQSYKFQIGTTKYVKWITEFDNGLHKNSIAGIMSNIERQMLLYDQGRQASFLKSFLFNILLEDSART